MKKLYFGLNIVSILIVFSATKLFAQQDAEGCKDHSLFTRFPNFYITGCSENYNELELRISVDKTEIKEGNLISIDYYYDFDKGEKAKSPLQIMKNLKCRMYNLF